VILKVSIFNVVKSVLGIYIIPQFVFTKKGYPDTYTYLQTAL